ncbi:MAG TPA: O-antigen ligase family protein [Solirubrobacterales bacterium]
MDSASMRRPAPLQRARQADWPTAAVWLLCFGLVVYLGIEGGGYDALIHDQVGIAVWWILLAVIAVGAVPRRRPGQVAWIALGLFAAFTIWTALSLTWTESTDRTSADLARVLGYLGIFAIAIFSRGLRESQRLIGAIAAAISVVFLIGLLSRLHPAWFPSAGQTGIILEDRERLSYPIDYWNGLAGLIAIGLPLLLQVATGAKTALMRALAAAAMPAAMLTLFLTLSRGGIAAAVLAVALFLALASDRLPKLATLLLAGAGGALLVAAANSRSALQEGLENDAARQQGSELFWIAIAVCVVVGLLQAALFSPALRGRRPGWTRISPDRALTATIVAAMVAVAAALLLGAPGRISNGWDEFKQGGGPGSGAGRLGSVSGQSRYQLWSAAVRENETKPLTGTGSGTFEFWWTRDGDTDETVRDTHSLYLQTLGELGIVGFALIVAFLGTIAVGGIRRLLAAPARDRPLYAAALAGFAAFCITAVFDWMWQLPALVVAALLLGSILVMPARPDPQEDERRSGPPMPLRVTAVAVALVAIVAIAIPLATTSLVRQSEADARRGDLAAALSAARTAQNVQPGAAGPRLQQALVLEARRELTAATDAALAATERESTNWRTWLVLSRIEAERGMAAAAVRDFRRARSLNPRSTLFQG